MFPSLLPKETPAKDPYDKAIDYQKIVDKLNGAIIVSTIAGKLRYCSPYTSILTGYSVEELGKMGGHFLQELMQPEYKPLYARALKYGIASEPFQFSYRLTHATGVDVWAETRSLPFNEPTDNSSDDLELLLLTFNISQLMLSQEQLEQRNKEIEDFTYMVSHDLKAPLFTIKGMLHLIDGEITNNKSRVYLSHLLRASERLENLVGSVLEYAKINEETEYEVVELRDVLSEVRRDFAPSLDPVGSCTVDESVPLPTIEGNRIRILQVFANLFSNSIKFRHDTRPLEIEIGCLPTLSMRLITIFFRDNGSGISSQILPTLFRPFKRGHQTEVEGSGIGLASVKKIVEKYGGKVEVESDSHGTTFLLSFRRTT